MTAQSPGWPARAAIGVSLLAGGSAFLHSVAVRADTGGDQAWQRTVSVEQRTDKDTDTTDSFGRHIQRYHVQYAQTYSDFRLEANPTSNSEWTGAARIDLRKLATTYSLTRRSYDGEEHGFENTASGSTVSQGVVRLFHGRNDSGKVTTCRIEVDATNDWLQRPELLIQEVGRHWDIYPGDPRNNRDSPQKQQSYLTGEFKGFEFPCDEDVVSYSGTGQNKLDATRQETYTWNVHRGAIPETEVEMIPPKEYEHWIPQGGDDEKTVGNLLDVRIVAHEKGKPAKSPPKKVRSYKIELVDTSKERGVALNWPPKSRATTDWDLKIDDQNSDITVNANSGGQTAQTRKDQEGLEDFMVTVNCYDWGAYGKLQVTATLLDGSTVVAHVQGHPDQPALSIPKDDNQNHIADWWEHTEGLKNTNEDADDDSTPGGGCHDGDSIPVYEEYRGFYQQGGHIRLKPDVKDLFLWDQDGIGIGDYSKTGIQTHLVDEDQTAIENGAENHTVVNPNRGHATLGPVYALLLTRGPIPGGSIGTIESVATPNGGVPKYIQYVRVDTARIEAVAGEHAEEEQRSTIAHELSHASNVWHHGEGDYGISSDVRCRGRDSVASQKCPSPPCFDTFNLICPLGANGMQQNCFEVAVQGGKYSGNQDCLMRYNSAAFYEYALGRCQWTHNGRTVRGKPYSHDPPGHSYCSDGKGTGVNDTINPDNKAGNASKGNCTHQLCVNSLKH